MVQTVKIRKGEKVIRVHFMYNTDLVDIMKEHNGWWFRKEKCWQFPLWKFDQIYDELKKKLYRVEISKLIEKPKEQDKKQTIIDYWADKDTIAVLGKCKKCKEMVFVDKDGICFRCK